MNELKKKVNELNRKINLLALLLVIALSVNMFVSGIVVMEKVFTKTMSHYFVDAMNDNSVIKQENNVRSKLK